MIEFIKCSFLHFPVILAVGVRVSTLFNNLFTGLNLLIVIYSVICGAFKADGKNWSLPPHNTTDVSQTNCILCYSVLYCAIL